jgi:hypothetical protein
VVAEAAAVQAAAVVVEVAVVEVAVVVQQRQLRQVPAPAQESVLPLPVQRGFHLLLQGPQIQYPGPKRRPGKGQQHGWRKEKSVR